MDNNKCWSVFLVKQVKFQFFFIVPVPLRLLCCLFLILFTLFVSTMISHVMKAGKGHDVTEHIFCVYLFSTQTLSSSKKDCFRRKNHDFSNQISWSPFAIFFCQSLLLFYTNALVHFHHLPRLLFYFQQQISGPNDACLLFFIPLADTQHAVLYM